MTDVKAKENENLKSNILDEYSNFKRLLEEALSYGYHVEKDEIKGISSTGYMTRFFEKYNIK